MGEKVSCTILILTYKGKHHLEFLLPTVKTAIAQTNRRYDIDVLIVDNGCDEITRSYVQNNFLGYKYSFSAANDYLFSLNSFVRELKSEFVFILNDDMKMEADVLSKILPVLEQDKQLFAVTCRIKDWEGQYTASAVRLARYDKAWMYSNFLDPKEENVKYTLYPGGGAAIFRTAYFNALGGFDSLYRPAYSEDSDLGIRAWQNNWPTIYFPAAVLYHREGGTIKDQFKKDKLEQMIRKNHILWMIKNVRHPRFLASFFILLPYRLLYSFFKNKNQYRAIILALPQISEALGKRRHTKVIVSQSTWLPLLNTPYIKAS